MNDPAAKFDEIVKGFEKLGGALTKVTPGLDKLVAATIEMGKKAVDGVPGLNLLTGAVGKMAKGFGQAVGAALQLGEAMGSLVAKAAPGVLMKFTQAADDLQAVVGNALIPVFELVTEVVRAAADTVSTFAGTIGGALGAVLRPFIDVLKVFFDVFGKVGQVIGKLATAAAPALAAFGQAMLAVYEALQPIINLVIDLLGGAFTLVMKGLAEVITTVVPYITAFVKVIGDMAKAFTDMIREALAFIGISLPEAAGTKPGSSVGAAAKSTSIGSVESVTAKAMQAAFSLGNGAGGDPAKEAAKAAEETAKRAKEIRDAINALPEKLATAIKNGATDRVENIVAPAKGALSDATGGLLGNPENFQRGWKVATEGARDFANRAIGGSGTVGGGGISDVISKIVAGASGR